MLKDIWIDKKKRVECDFVTLQDTNLVKIISGYLVPVDCRPVLMPAKFAEKSQETLYFRKSIFVVIVSKCL